MCSECLLLVCAEYSMGKSVYPLIPSSPHQNFKNSFYHDSKVTKGIWTCRESNPGSPPCEGGALPLCHKPDDIWIQKIW
jgi:hypothetical protein